MLIYAAPLQSRPSLSPNLCPPAAQSITSGHTDRGGGPHGDTEERHLTRHDSQHISLPATITITIPLSANLSKVHPPYPSVHHLSIH